MADDVQYQSVKPATPPDTALIAADDVDGVKYQRMKLVTGVDGEVIGDLSTRHPLPVTDQIGADILCQLKKMNLYLALIVGFDLSDQDVTEGA